MAKALELTGKTFGRLRVIRRLERNASGNFLWECVCTCGAKVIAVGAKLKIGHTRSCGCLVVDTSTRKATSHGHATNGISPEYRVWASMKSRCLDPSNKSFSYYGGKGITVCKRWMSFANFLADMGLRPKGLTLDRKDGARGYCKSNCRWATRATQSRNTQQAKLSMAKARAIRADTRTTVVIAKEYGVSEYAIYAVRTGKTWKENAV